MVCIITKGGLTGGGLDGLATSPAGGHGPLAREVALAKLSGPLLRKQTRSIFLFDMVGWRFITKKSFAHRFLSTL